MERRLAAHDTSLDAPVGQQEDGGNLTYGDFVRVGGWKVAREQGLARAEGKEYVVQDGDVMLFRFSS